MIEPQRMPQALWLTLLIPKLAPPKVPRRPTRLVAQRASVPQRAVNQTETFISNV